MPTLRSRGFDATILGAASLLALAMGGSPEATPATERFETASPPAASAEQGGAARFFGVWMNADNTVRLDVASDGSFERSIVGRKRSARGVYMVSGTRLLLRDESGVRTTVTSGPGYLEMAGYQLARI
jgi:hypothetical protein